MTKLIPGRPTVRETDVYEHTSPIVVALHPRYLTVKLKGERGYVTVEYGQLLSYGRRTGGYTKTAR